MIRLLRGELLAKGDNWALLEVAGIGFRVYVPSPALDELGVGGSPVTLYTHLHVREKELSLYGCLTEEELEIFELLLGVSGIGPKVALNVLSFVSPDALRLAISQGDAAVLTRIPGIGRRTAEQLIVGLKHRLTVPGEVPLSPLLSAEDAEVIAALTALGYSVAEARAALRSLPQEEFPVEERVRLALQYFVEP
jgi:Holliday junction DNA helicase RuvA